ncbi:MAG: NTP transferase domain-containing protein [Deltaproteobacteria bacterium]|nr:NTP transferase domain-containing protein [Deltaproteobacteria bacterium]
MKAVILAAGRGERLQSKKPKSLTHICGLTLLERSILTAKKAHIEDFVIVVGYRGDAVQYYINKKYKDIRIQWVVNEDWHKENGYSLLKTRPYVDDPFILLMGDHILQPGFLENFIQATVHPLLSPLPSRERKNGGSKADNRDPDEVVLAIDSKMSSIFDLEDASKVDQEDFKIKNTGKEIEKYNAIDTGVFYCTPFIFKVLGYLKDKRDFSLSLINTVKYLAELRKIRCYDIGAFEWQDVDTPSSLKHGEKLLLKWCRKPTDGIISKNLNRPISLWISRLLSYLPITPLYVSLCGLVVGLFSCACALSGDFLKAFFFFQLASVLDGCDGEVAKLKFEQSEKGAWVDTLSDNVVYVLFVLSFGIGLSSYYHSSYYLFLSSIGFFFLVIALLSMYFYLKKNKSHGTLVLIERAVFNLGRQKKVFLSFLPRYFSFVVKRDFYAFSFFILALFKQWLPIFYLLIAGCFVVCLYSLVLLRKYEAQTV